MLNWVYGIGALAVGFFGLRYAAGQPAAGQPASNSTSPLFVSSGGGGGGFAGMPMSTTSGGSGLPDIPDIAGFTYPELPSTNVYDSQIAFYNTQAKLAGINAEQYATGLAFDLMSRQQEAQQLFDWQTAHYALDQEYQYKLSALDLEKQRLALELARAGAAGDALPPPRPDHVEEYPRNTVNPFDGKTVDKKVDNDYVPDGAKRKDVTLYPTVNPPKDLVVAPAAPATYQLQSDGTFAASGKKGSVSVTQQQADTLYQAYHSGISQAEFTQKLFEQSVGHSDADIARALNMSKINPAYTFSAGDVQKWKSENVK